MTRKLSLPTLMPRRTTCLQATKLQRYHRRRLRDLYLRSFPTLRLYKPHAGDGYISYGESGRSFDELKEIRQCSIVTLFALGR